MKNPEINFKRIVKLGGSFAIAYMLAGCDADMSQGSVGGSRDIAIEASQDFACFQAYPVGEVGTQYQPVIYDAFQRSGANENPENDYEVNHKRFLYDADGDGEVTIYSMPSGHLLDKGPNGDVYGTIAQIDANSQYAFFFNEGAKVCLNNTSLANLIGNNGDIRFTSLQLTLRSVPDPRYSE